MKVKIFADQCVPRSIVTGIKEAGFEVVKLADVIANDSPDSIVIAKAQELGCVLLSLNGDFADIITYPPQKHAGVIAIQVRNHPESVPYIIMRLKAFMDEHPDADDYKGKLFIVEVHRIRIIK